MNIDDLKQTLVQMADEVDPLDQANRLRAVEAKVTARRRRRVGAGVAIAAAVAIAVPALLTGGSGSPDPAHHTETSSSGLPTVEDNGVTFYTSPAGDTLVGEAVGSPGQRSVTLRVVAPSTDLTYQSICWQPDVHVRQQMMYHVTVNGIPIADRSCEEPAGPLGSGGRFGASPQANRTFWRVEAAVVPGEPMTLRAFFRPGEEMPESARLGIALYDETGPMVRLHDVWLDRQVVVSGHTYQLVRSGFADVHGRSGKVALDLPPTVSPLYVVRGVTDVHGPYRTSGGRSGSSIQAGTPSSTGDLTPVDQSRATMSIHLRSRPGALIYLLAYRQVD